MAPRSAASMPRTASRRTPMAISVRLPARSETGITVSHDGHAAILVAIETKTSTLSGWTIGVRDELSTTAFYQGAGITYPDPTSAFVALFVTQPGPGEKGLAG